MPHAEIRYSSDLKIDPLAILCRIEDTILEHDSGAGECKGRAYPAPVFHHSHILVCVTMLRKPHRDSAFTAGLLKALETAVKDLISDHCFFSMSLEYSPFTYVTNQHNGAASASR